MAPLVIPGARALGAPLPGSVVTLGAFDGVHVGHRELIRRAVLRARELGVECVAYTFDPHPAKLLAPEFAPQTLCSVRERVRLLGLLGVDRVIVEPFDHTFAELHADAWVTSHLAGMLRPSHVVVGFNFSYGHARSGNPEQLRRAGGAHGFTVDVVEPVQVHSIIVSSTRVRELLLEGNVEGARLMLDRHHGLTGVVVEGERRGQTLGFPTANLAPEAELIPAHGVYASRVILDDGAAQGHGAPVFSAVTNIGLRPTFSGTSVSIESHLLDTRLDLYRRHLRVELVAHVREERRFPGPEALTAQIRADVEAARRLLAAAPKSG